MTSEKGRLRARPLFGVAAEGRSISVLFADDDTVGRLAAGALVLVRDLPSLTGYQHATIERENDDGTFDVKLAADVHELDFDVRTFALSYFRMPRPTLVRPPPTAQQI